MEKEGREKKRELEKKGRGRMKEGRKKKERK